jgi:hypothetical protein
MSKNGLTKLSFQVSDTKTVSILMTAFTSSPPVMTLTRPGDSRAIDTSYNASSGFITFDPRANEVGASKTFVISLQAGNSSTISVLVKNPSNDASPALLMVGIPQYDRTNKGSEQYYALHVPAGLKGDLSIIVDPIQVGYCLLWWRLILSSALFPGRC